VAGVNSNNLIISRNQGGVKLIYKNICRIAKEKGMSINHLEKIAGISRGSICKWGSADENNKVEPGIWKLEKVAKILDVSVEQLIEKTIS
jgi:transcriptional regulator with XRE-family HTH domain